MVIRGLLEGILTLFIEVTGVTKNTLLRYDHDNHDNPDSPDSHNIRDDIMVKVPCSQSLRV